MTTFFRFLRAMAIAAIAVAVLVPSFWPIAVAIAQEAAPASDTTVTINIGAILALIAPVLLALVGAAVAYGLILLPPSIASALKMARVDQLMQNAVQYGINATVDATKDKPLTFDVGVKVAAQAAQYVVDNGPAWLIKWMGGIEGVKQKIVARLNVDAEAAVTPDVIPTPSVPAKK